MKKRTIIATFEAADIQKKLSIVKHKRARELLESRLRSTYIESFIDLDVLKAVIWIPYQSYVSDRVMEEIHGMVLSIIEKYPQIQKVDVYGRDAIIEAIKTGEFKEIPKTSIVQPELEEQNKDVIPSIMVNDTNLIHCDEETKEQVESFLDLKDNTLLKMKKEPGPSSERGDLEAGEIRIIIETIDELKNGPLTKNI